MRICAAAGIRGNSARGVCIFLEGVAEVTCVGGREFFGCAHWVSGAGLRLPNDGGAQSKMSCCTNSFDLQLTRRNYAVTQLN